MTSNKPIKHRIRPVPYNCPASSFRSESFTQKIQAIRSVLVEEEEETSKLLIDQDIIQESGVKAKLWEDTQDNDSEKK